MSSPLRVGLHKAPWLVVAALLLAIVTTLHAQTTATLSGTVVDPSQGRIPGAQVVLENDATHEQRSTVSDADGVFTLPALLPGTYSINIKAKGFKTYEQHGIVLDAGDVRKLPDSILPIGAASESVTVEENAEIVPLESGERAAILDNKDIENLALGSRDLSELLKVLPGVTTSPNGLSNGPAYNFESVSTGQSAVGNGLVANGAPNRGGTSQLLDGVDIDDPGCDCNAIALVDPDMTQEVSVQTSNFGADAPYGPVVVSTISKSGGAQYHGEGYFYARNDVLNANTWPNDQQKIAKAGAHYYYPGGNIGGPVPWTQKKLLWWFGYERLLQNTGNTNILESFIPTPDMMSGNFSATTANSAFCLGAANINGTQTNGCNNLAGTVLPNGQATGPGTIYGSTIPSQFIDPGALALASFWPKPNANPATTPGNFNYYQPIPGIHDGWLVRARVDYNLNDASKIYVSYQQGYDTALSQGNGAHIYWTPYNAIPYPGGGLYSSSYTKAVAGHFIHTFNSRMTDEFIASWGYGYFPVGPANPNAATRSALNYPASYGTVFNTGSLVPPSYSSPGFETFPDFSQQDIFENSSHTYLVRKEMPAFADNFTMVWGKHTIKVGAFTENVGNIQGASESPNGSFNSFSFGGTLTPNVITGQRVGSPNNPTANFLMGITTSYSENNSSPVSNMAYQIFAGYVDDLWKTSNHLTIELGLRLDHQGHWYDRNKVGMAVFLPDRVVSDYYSNKMNPGVYYHGNDPGIPNSGMPDRLAYMDPRIGMAYDVFGNGKSMIRGGWGIYRFSDQYNDYTGALTTAQSILGYGLPGSSSVFFSQLGKIAAPTPTCGPTTGAGGTPCINGGISALDGTNFQIPMTTAWNLTISQQVPWRSLVEVAYVGNLSENIPIGGQSISGSGFQAFTDMNKIPLGAFFKPDPVTGLVATNPEDVTSTCAGTVCNKTADYRPYGKEYGDNTVYVLSTAAYSNYHGLQVSAVKRSSKANFDLNYTWSKSLSTNLNLNAFNLRDNYGLTPYNRTHVVNLSGSYDFGNIYHGQKMLEGASNGWTISNITTWQSGGNLQAINNANFGMSLQYANPPAGVGTGLSQATYYGTNATINITPLVNCDPTSNTAHNQRIKYSCFTPPPIGSYGPRNYPYTMAPYFDSDLSLFKAFHVYKENTVQFRADAFNWLNHPLPQYSGGSQLSLHYNVDYYTKAFTPSTSQYPSGNPNNFGVLDTKAGNPNQRTLELSLKYLF